MDRLTERLSNGQAAVYGCGNNCKYDFKYCNNHLEDCPTINEIYERLAQYEEIGTVECFKNALKNVRTLSNMYEKLRDQEVAEFHKLAEYEELEEQGKLLKLPCTVGDTVWYWDKEYDPIEEAPFEGYVSGYEIVSGKTVYIIIVPKKNFIPAWNDNSKYKIEIEEFGKAVFLTKKEAEAALKGLLTSKQP